MTTTLAQNIPPIDSPSVNDPNLLAWRNAKISPVSPDGDRHSIHSYFVTCPESPDGRNLLYYTSSTPEGELGEIRVRDRATGKERILAQNIHTEDAHRAACQQWSSNGKMVVFHDCREGRWVVVAIDLATGKEKILAEDRQVGFGSPKGDWVPVYGCHWKPGTHRDLELINVQTGEIRTPVRMADVLAGHAKEIEELVGQGDVSIFFPVVSPDEKKVFFKIAKGSGEDDFKSKAASAREGKFVYSLEDGSFIRLFRQWGHPSWTPDSKGIFEKGNSLFDLKTGAGKMYAPGSPSDHPSVAPGQAVFVTDADISKRTGKPGEWGITVGSMKVNEFATIYRFNNSGGAKSWRKNHPHPVFSDDGKRIYFNVNDGPWTRLYVAEIP